MNIFPFTKSAETPERAATSPAIPFDKVPGVYKTVQAHRADVPLERGRVLRGEWYETLGGRLIRPVWTVRQSPVMASKEAFRQHQRMIDPVYLMQQRQERETDHGQLRIRPGETLEVPQAIAYNLFIVKGVVQIVSGGQVEIVEFADGAHGYIPWTCYGQSYNAQLGCCPGARPSEKDPWELVQVLNPDNPDGTPGAVWPDRHGALFRFVMANGLPGSVCFLGEPTDGKRYQVQRLRDRRVASESALDAEDRRWIRMKRLQEQQEAERLKKLATV